jgi:hypothetical protein
MNQQGPCCLFVLYQTLIINSLAMALTVGVAIGQDVVSSLRP